MSSNPNIFTIPACCPFGRTLARGLLERYGARGSDLSGALILLPTRRSCRALREMFLQITGGRPVLLPRLQPFGDIDEEELALSLGDSDLGRAFFEIPPPMPPLRRQILLARLIMRAGRFTENYPQALALSESLGRFIDQIYIEELDQTALDRLVPEEFAAHWQITLDFLKIILEQWPKVLAAESAIDAADRRGRLMHILAEYWRQNPPDIPVIAAGSTGSIPATERLMEIIASLPAGEVILPGYDQDIDEESWEALEPSHAQYGFKNLFARMNIDRSVVRTWPDLKDQGSGASARLAREIMRPAASADVWMDLRHSAQAVEAIRVACKNLGYIETETMREEAGTIALIFRETLESPGKTAALITPDRELARRVISACRRWRVHVDDSAGEALTKTELGSFLMLIYEACLQDLAPTALLALLKHPLCRLEYTEKERRSAIGMFELYLLRGLRPRPAFDGLKTRLAAADMPENVQETISGLLDRLESALGELIRICADDKPCDLTALLQSHLMVAEKLAATPEDKTAGHLWSGDTGEQAAGFFAGLLEELTHAEGINPSSYPAVLQVLMDAVSIRPRYGTHPRLAIYGQLEARLIDADVMILAGLNERTWPPATPHDPYMSRPMRADFGLPSPERAAGLAAHDFVQGFCLAGEERRVFLTRAKKEGGAETTPARWLQRLETVLSAAGLKPTIIKNETYRNYNKKLDQADEIAFVHRPRPCPPIHARPRKLPVTKVETWLQDPYQIYARYVLKLKPLEPLEQPVDAAQKGQILHDILERFVCEYPDALPEKSFDALMHYVEEVLEERELDSESYAFWQPRFESMARWYLKTEEDWRYEAKPLKTEARGKIVVNDTFTLHGIADRIDALKAGGACILDYKSGGNFSKKDVLSGKKPQLALEGLILTEGGFDSLGRHKPELLSYWVLSGGAKGGQKLDVSENIRAIIEETRAGLCALIETYSDPEVPYVALPRSDRVPAYNDYAHLERVLEWRAAGEEETG